MSLFSHASALALPQNDAQSQSRAQTIFFLGLLLAASGVCSPPVALAGGILFGCLFEHPYRRESAALARLLLQASVVALGFGMNLQQVLHAGRAGFLYTAVSISCALALGLALGCLLQVRGKASLLISAGTAICGGSAIAAIAPVAGAGEEEISVAMGTVFLLNSIALLLFPSIGWALHLDQHQFGLWCALAIHDTSSVVGAAAHYGAQALAIGTTVKLARALWIVPLSLGIAASTRRRGGAAFKLPAQGARTAVPWFILFFCLASFATTCLPRFAPSYALLWHLGRSGLTATLFLIGTSLSVETLRKVGLRPLVQGVVLWVIVAGLSLAAVAHRWISI